MKIESVKALGGANVYSHRPVTVMRLDLEELKGKDSRELENFQNRLLDSLPGLKEHFCAAGKAGGFVERLKAGTHFNHVVEHVAIELLAQAGFDERDKKICNSDEKDDSKAVIETTAVETTRYLMPVAAELVEALAFEKSFFVEEKIAEAKNIAADTELGPSGRAIVDAAEKRGIPWRRESDANSLVQLGYGRNLRLVQAAMTDRTGIIAADLAGNKDATKRRLEEFSMPVPYGKIVRSEEQAVRALESIGAPVVVKPLDGRQGKGVSLNLKTAEEVREAFRIAREYSSKVLVEELFEGGNYRVLVVGGKMVAASERVPCGITGDGAHTVAELIEIENRNPLRGEGHEKPLTKIKIDPIIIAALRKEGWQMEDVPEAGKRVSLCAGMNLSTGGTAKDVTDSVHKSVKSLCERAARVVGLDICGVDLVLEDISAPVPTEKGGIIELNAAPGLRMHTHPSEGAPRDVGGAIIEMLYPNPQDGRIPVISITGTNGKTTVTRMISHILAGENLNVGTTTSSGIFIGGERIARGDTTGPISARTILGDKAVDVAVLETARGGILRRGLAYDWSDISVLTNISEDHIGQDGIESVEDLIPIKALIAERVRAGGTLIINADDANSLRVLEREKVKAIDKQIVYFTFDENNPRVREHLENGGTAYVATNDLIVELVGDKSFDVVGSRDIPVTLGGTADFQTANSMAAIAACRAFGIAREQIVSRLKTFRTDTDNPGRNNLYKVGKGYALVDYGHNPDGFQAICRMVSKWQGKTVTGIINIAGDRDDRIVKEAAKVAAGCFQRVIATEDLDRRGRAAGEIPRLLSETVKAENPDIPCEIMPNETEAVSKAIGEIAENEVVVIFYDDLTAVLDVLNRNGAAPVYSFEENTSVQAASRRIHEIMLTLIENGEIYTPAEAGRNSILIAAGKIIKVGEINRQILESLHLKLDVIDANDCIVTPGLIDPHEHLLGGSGEKGFATQTPELYASEIVSAGITTVVGCLGVDSTMKTMAGLLAKAKGLKEEGLSAFVWTGGYDVPPTTVTDSARNDILFIEEIIGAGEIAVSDERSTDPQPHELARLVSDTHNGGMLSKKAGATHFHVGTGEARLKLLRTLIDEYDISAEWLFPTHITRSEELMREAIELAGRGSFVNIDTVDKDLPKWFKFYLDNGGLPDKLTVSTDASITSPRNLLEQMRRCILEQKFPIAQVFACATANTANALKLEQKGTLEAGRDADVLILRRDTLEIRDVIANGRRLYKNGKLDFKEKFLEESDRAIELRGDK